MSKSRAFTLVELLVVIAIIGVLIGMAVPAMQNMRELSRRTSCEHNLMQVSLALSMYSTRHGHYPIGTVADSGPIRSEAKGYHHNWLSGLLPMLDAQNVFDAVDRSVSVYDSANDPVRNLRMPTLQCPSATGVRDNTSCYAGIHSSTETAIDVDNDGVFILNRPIRDDDITDGLGYTIFVGEKLSPYEDDLGWISGTRSSLRNLGHPINEERKRVYGPQDPKDVVDALYVGGLASNHASGAYVLMGSGEYAFRNSSMDMNLLKQMANRADGGIPSEWKSQQPLDDAATTKPPASEESQGEGGQSESEEPTTPANSTDDAAADSNSTNDAAADSSTPDDSATDDAATDDAATDEETVSGDGGDLESDQ